MIPENLRYILPSLPPVADERIAIHHVTREFFREVEFRDDRRRYCQWYRQTARQHQRELEAMRGDINLFGWFCQRRGKFE